MPHYLLLSRSITHAQRMRSSLETVGIQCRILRPPAGLSDKGCSYAVRILEKGFESSMVRLRETNLLPVRVFYTLGDGVYREIGSR